MADPKQPPPTKAAMKLPSIDLKSLNEPLPPAPSPRGSVGGKGPIPLNNDNIPMPSPRASPRASAMKDEGLPPPSPRSSSMPSLLRSSTNRGLKDSDPSLPPPSRTSQPGGNWRGSVTLVKGDFTTGPMTPRGQLRDPQGETPPLTPRRSRANSTVSDPKDEKEKKDKKDKKEEKEALPMAPLPPAEPVPEDDSSRAVKSEILARLSSYVDRLNSDEVKAEAAKHPELFAVPHGDIAVVNRPRQHRTVKPSVTPELYTGVEPYVAAAFNAFTKDYTTVQWPAVTLAKEPEPEEEPKPASGDIDERLLHPVNSEVRRNVQLARRKGRGYIFQKKAPPNTAPLLQATPSSRMRVKTTSTVMVRVDALYFTTGPFEPLFCCMTLYNLRTAERLSESFYFDMNDGRSADVIRTRMQDADVESKARVALFTLPSASSDAVIIIRLERILRGEETQQALEPYVHHDAMKPKEKEKLNAEIEYAAARLGRYTQPLAYMITSLYDDNGHLLNNGKLELTRFKKWKNGLTEVYICDKEAERRKEKVDDSARHFLPCTVKLTVRHVNKEVERLHGLLDTTLNPVKPPAHTANEMTKELQPFFDQTDIVAPHISYINTLYVYPHAIGLGKLKDTSGRNLSIRIKLMETDADPEAAGLKAIYGRSSSKNFVSEWYTSVSYHDPHPVWNEEIKIKLPPRLTPSLHLLFSFYHISCKTKDKRLQSGDKESVDDLPALIGHAFLPVLSVDPDTLRLSNRALADEESDLPVTHTIAPGYLNPTNEGVKWLDNRRHMFTLRTKGVTSIFSHSEQLNTFWKKWQTSHENAEFVAAIRALQDVEPRLLVTFFPLLLDQLFAVLTNRAEPAAREAAWTIIHILECVTETIPSAESRHPMLVSYVEHQLELNAAGQRLAHDELLRFLLAVLPENGTRAQMALRHVWFLLEVILKSMVLKLHKTGKLSQYDQRKAEFTHAFTDPLKRLFLTYLAPEMTTPRLLRLSSKAHHNDTIAQTLLQLLSLVERTIVIEILYRYVAILNSRSEIALKLHLLDVISRAPHYVILDLPLNVKIVSVGSLVGDFWRTHLLSGLLLNETLLTLQHADADSQLDALDIIARLMSRIEADARLSDRASKERAAAAFFPFLVISLEQLPLLRNATLQVQLSWLHILLWVLRYCSRKQLVREWWRQDTQRSHIALLTILLLTTEAFPVPENAALAQETALICLDTLEDFMWDFRNEILPPSLLSNTAPLVRTGAEDESSSDASDLLDLTHTLLLALLQREQTQRSITEIFWFFIVFVRDYRRLLFQHSNPAYCGELTDEVLRYMNSSFHDVRAKATAVFFLLLRTNYELTGDCARLKLQATLAISRIAGAEVSHYSFLEASLRAVAQRAGKETPEREKPRDHHSLRPSSHSSSPAHSQPGTLRSHAHTPPPAAHTPPPAAQSPAPAPVKAPLPAALPPLAPAPFAPPAGLPPLNIPPPSALPPPLISPAGSGSAPYPSPIFPLSARGPLPPRDLLPPSILSSFMPKLTMKSPKAKLAKGPSEKKVVPFARKVDALAIRLRQIIEDSVRLAAAKYDPELTADLYYQIAVSHADSPDLRVTWLENLAAFHYANRDYEEAASCKVIIAHLIAMYLRSDPSSAHHITPKVSEALAAISTNLGAEPPLPELSLKAEGVYQPKVFSLQGLMTSLRHAVQMLKQGEVYELAIDVYHVVSELLGSNYLKLAPVYLDLRNISTALVEAAYKQTRSFGSFFRVTFYGREALKEMDGKAYIYRTSESLAELTERLKKQLSAKAGAVKVSVLPTEWNEAQAAALDASLAHLHVIPVKEYWDSASEERRTAYDRKHHVSYFTTDTVSDQSTDKLLTASRPVALMTTSFAFPFVKKRLQVTGRKDTVLSPLDNCMACLQEATYLVRTELAAEPLNVKGLQAALQQHLLQRSNLVLDIVRTFLVPNPTAHPLEVRERLRNCVGDFVQTIGTAVARNNTVIGPAQLDFQTLCEAAFINIKRGLKQLLPEEEFRKLQLS